MVVLLGLYAFLIPFELVLEVYFNIDTILKPYRVIALMLIGIFLFTQIKHQAIYKHVWQDMVLYAIFVYGLLVSLFQMIVVSFSMGRFYNDLFQMGLYLAVFFIFKNSQLSRLNLITIFRCLIAGITLNAAQVFYNFYFLKDYSRQAGFMDNPNYLSLSIIVAVIFLLIKVEQRPNWRKIINLLLIPFLGVVFIISGSRTGLLIVVILTVIFFFFQNLKGRLAMLGLVIFIGIGSLFFTDEAGINSSTPLVLLNRLEQVDLLDDPRFPLWRGAIRAAQQSNFMGLGIGQFKFRFGEFFDGETNLVIYRILAFGYHLSPHSDYFSILVTYGVLGVLLYITYVMLILRKLILKIWSSPPLLEKNFYQLQFMILSTIALFGLGAENFNSPIFWFLLVFSTTYIPYQRHLSNQKEHV